MPECANCGAFVSLGFAHVFRADGDVPSCPACVPDAEAGLPVAEVERRRGTAVAEGEAAPDTEGST